MYYCVSTVCVLCDVCVCEHSGTDSILYRAIDVGKEKGWVKAGDAIVCVHGAKEAVAGSTNSLRVLIA